MNMKNNNITVYSVHSPMSMKNNNITVYSVHSPMNMKNNNITVYSVHRLISLEQWIFKLLHNSIKYTQDGLNVVILFHRFMGLTVQI